MDKSPEASKRFFDQSTVDEFFEKRSTIIDKKRIFTINKNNVEVIAKEMMMPPQTSEATNDENRNGEGECPCNGVPPGNRGMRVFQPIYVNDEENDDIDDNASNVVSCYKVTLPNPLQFDYMVSLIDAALIFRQISQVALENRNQIGYAVRTGCVSEGKASCFSRIVCAVGL